MPSDQTPERDRVIGQDAQQLGTGVFLQIGASGETMVTFQQNLTYQDCADVGGDFEAFKWVPLARASFAAVMDSRCELVGEPCSKSCDAMGCLCNRAAGQCVDASGNSNLPPITGSSNSGSQMTVTGSLETVDFVSGD